MLNRSSSTNFVHWPYQEPPEFHPFWFEKIDYDWWKEYAADKWHYSFYVGFLYLITIFSLSRWMKERKPFNLNLSLALWNLSLGLLSSIAAFRIGQELVNVLLLPNGFHTSVCSRIGLNRPAAFYSVTFALSKYIELGDTLFIVLRKRPLTFIQWYHHFATLILAWQVMPYSEPIFRWYGVMNYTIHFIMYTYFAIRAVDIRVPHAVPIMITTLQLFQFVFGVFINCYSWRLSYVYGPEACARDPESIKWIGGVYASFMCLFAHFFYRRYFSKKTKVM